MKKISIMLVGLLMTTAAMAQQTVKHMSMLGDKKNDRREKSRELAFRIMRGKKGNAQAKSTASYERMIGFTDYQSNQQGGQLMIADSGSLAYSGMRGSSYDFNNMSIGYFDPIFGAMTPDNKLTFMADNFNLYANTNVSSLAAAYTFTYDNNDNVTEVYIADYQGNPDSRMLFTYGANGPTYGEMLNQNGPNWDTVDKRYYNYDVSGMLTEDSVMENNGGIWSIYQKYEYTYDVNGNITVLRTSDLNNTNSIFEPNNEVHNTYNTNDQVELTTYYYYDEVNMNMALDSKDSFEYTTGIDFTTKDTYSEWDDVNTTWTPVGYMEKTLNIQMLPASASVFNWTGSAWESYYTNTYNYTSHGNPMHDSLFAYTNQQIDDDPSYVGNYYYQEYYDLAVKNTDAAKAVISVYPNPATDMLNVSNSNNTPMQLQLVNALGQTVKTARSSAQAKLSIGDLTAGMYWLTVTDSHGNKLHQQAVVKQ